MFHIYARVSSLGQAEDNKISIPDQIARGRALAHFAGARNIDVLEWRDEGVSGSVKLTDRFAGGGMWEDLEPGDTVVAAKLDRMFRSASDALTMIEKFQERKVNLILLDMGNEPVQSSPYAKLFFSMLAAFADFERGLIKERTLSGRHGKRDRGGHIGGHTPYGWQKVGKGTAATLVPHEQEQEVVRFVFWRMSRGRPMAAILAELKEYGYVTRTGRDFAPVQVSRIYRWERDRLKREKKAA